MNYLRQFYNFICIKILNALIVFIRFIIGFVIKNKNNAIKNHNYKNNILIKLENITQNC